MPHNNPQTMYYSGVDYTVPFTILGVIIGLGISTTISVRSGDFLISIIALTSTLGWIAGFIGLIVSSK